MPPSFAEHQKYNNNTYSLINVKNDELWKANLPIGNDKTDDKA